MPKPNGSDPVLRKLRLPLFLTRAGLLAEQVVRNFWPLVSVVLLILAALMLGLHDVLPIELVWGGAVSGVVAVLGACTYGVRNFHMPNRAEALARLDETLPGRPIQALLDDQAIGGEDDASAALWQAHQQRMAKRASGARAAKPDLRISRRDPYALRFLAVLAFAVAVLFGSVWRVGSVANMAPGSMDLANGPSWEGWIEAPRYTGRPTLYLNDIKTSKMSVPEGSRITLRFYGEVGALTLAETVSGRTGNIPSAADPAQEFVVMQDGELRIDGPGGQRWIVTMEQDTAPLVAISGPVQSEASGELTLPFTASDDYGVVAGSAVIALNLDALDRRYGLLVPPEHREAITIPLPMPISGDRRMFTETMIEDLSKHPWANLPVIFTLQVEDAAGLVTIEEPFSGILSARRFFDPMAASVIEMRRDLLWSRENAPYVAQVLRAVSHLPGDVFRSETSYLLMRVILRRLETMISQDLTAEQQDEIAEALWGLAIVLEDGDLGDALERMRRAQERLSEATRNGASQQEIAELMQELRDATQDYMRQMSRQAQQDNPQQQGGESVQMSQDDLQRMMDHIQELMEQGRMAEAEQALKEFQEMMENMRMAQGQGQGDQSDGQQAMDGIADTLREQQGLSDRAFRDLQEQFNPDAQSGESDQNEGRNGGQGRGQSHEGQGGSGQGDEDSQSSEGRGGKGALADRQQALRDELGRQKGNLPGGGGTPDGEAAREALERAGRAMDGAEDALRQDDLAGAIDRQSEAMEALRESMRSLGDAMARDQQNPQGQGNTESEMQGAQGNDPLGRTPGRNGAHGSEERLLQGEDVYRRARDLLDEIRRRSGDGDRPKVEKDYLQRLLDRF